MPSNHWLLKTEPHTYSFSDLTRDKSTDWNGVRNYQARNFLRSMKVGDLAIIYHSGDERAAVGTAKIIKAPYPDLDPDGGDWTQVDIAAVKPFRHPVSLTTIKATPLLKDMPLIKQSRLSVMPISRDHYESLLKLGQTQ